MLQQKNIKSVNFLSGAKYINAAVLLIFLLCTIAMLYPLSINLTSRLPDTGDSFHNIWTWGDNINRIEQGRNYFEANIYYPEKRAAIFGEIQLNNTIIFYPFFRWLGNPVLGFNFILIISFVLSGFFTYLISLHFTENKITSFIAGFIFAFFPYRYAHLPHAQLLCFHWVLIPLYYLIKYLKDKRNSHLMLFAVFLCCQAVSIGYNTIYLYIFIFSYLLYSYFFSDKGPERKYHLNIVSAVIIVIIICVPFYFPYLKGSSAGYIRSLDELKMYGMDIFLLFSSLPINRLYGELTRPLWSIRFDGVISSVFPGVVVLSLVIFSATKTVLDIKRDIKKEWQKLFFICISIFFFLMIFGPIIKMKNRELFANPVYPLFKFIPVFSAIRYVPNYIHPLMFSLSIVISMALSSLKAFKGKSHSFVLPVIVTALIGFEYNSKIPMTNDIPYGENIPKVYSWLKTQSQKPVIEMPVLDQNINCSGKYAPDQFYYQYYSIYHGMPIVNGCSGFFPDGWKQTMESMQTFPSIGSLTKLSEIGVKYVILHDDRMDNKSIILNRIKRFSRLKEIYRDNNSHVLLIDHDLFYDSRYTTSIHPDKLTYKIIRESIPSSVSVGDSLPISIVLQNSGNTIWISNTNFETPPGKGEVRLGLKYWEREDGYRPSFYNDPETLLSSRGKLLFDIFPGEKIEITMNAQAPDKPGRYIIRINLVDELIAWFPQRDIEMPISVKERNTNKGH